MANQEIEGNNNVQIRDVDGNVIVNTGPDFDPSNPGLISCPVCSRLVSYNADACPDCHDNLRRRREVAAREAKQKDLMSTIGYLAVFAAIAFGVARLFPSVATQAYLLMVLAIILMGALSKGL